VAWKKEMLLLKSDVTRVALDEMVADLRRAIEDQRFEPGMDDALAAASRTLSEALLLPQIGALLPAAVRRIVVVPSDVMTNLPWPLFATNDGLLGVRFALSLVPGIQWIDVRRTRWRRPSYPLVVAISEFEDGHEPLPEAEGEALRVARELGRSTNLLLCANADARRVTESLRGADWAHFATHGSFVVADPGESHIVLHRSYLRAHDLTGIDLRRLEGIVLSACEAALHAVLPGQELLGLPAALLLAGVPRVIAPLWPVEDEISLSFMNEFYVELKQVSPAQALTNVRRRWLEDADASRRAPRSWASYALWGSPG
jgi:CHAT domain-containing protein